VVLSEVLEDDVLYNGLIGAPGCSRAWEHFLTFPSGPILGFS
jgi:hypothetical protein